MPSDELEQAFNVPIMLDETLIRAHTSSIHKCDNKFSPRQTRICTSRIWCFAELNGPSLVWPKIAKVPRK